MLRPAAPADSDLLQRGIHLFNTRQFFECHEVWEEAWTPQRGPRRLFLQSLIHFAVGLYHAGRANPEGARRQLRKGLRKLAAYLPDCEGIDTARLHAECAAALAAIERAAPFEVPRIHLIEEIAEESAGGIAGEIAGEIAASEIQILPPPRK